MAECDESPEYYFADSNGSYPWDSPCWNDDWEHELRAKSHNTSQEWNQLGRIVKKGEKGRFLPCARITVFSESQTEESKIKPILNTPNDTSLHFESFEDAKNWSIKNGGAVFTRSPWGNGFIPKQLKGFK